MRRLLVLPAVGALIVASAAAASAVTTRVLPGTGTLQAAIDAAAPGDTLVGAGLYQGPVVVDKPLKIVVDRKAPEGAILIDLECAAAVGLTISADKVQTKGTIAVYGATTTGVVVDGTTRSKLGTISAFESCGTAATGFVVRNTTRTSFRGGGVFYFSDAAIRIEDLPIKSRVKFWGYQGISAAVGLAIANVAEGAGRKGAGLSIRVIINGGAGDGVVLSNADGVVIEKGSFSDGLTGTGVTIDAASANNLFRFNSVHTVSDAGVNTCWKGNLGYAGPCP
jgi:hypothetical protein